MRYRVIAVGRLRSGALRSACNEYLDRLQHYAKVEEREVKDEARILDGVGEDGRLVALSRRGDPWSSSELAGMTARWEQEGRDVAFAIGGADGLPQSILARAEWVWSFSPLTFPHEIARLLLYEQLYRAYTIRRNEPYHRGA